MHPRSIRVSFGKCTAMALCLAAMITCGRDTKNEGPKIGDGSTQTPPPKIPLLDAGNASTLAVLCDHVPPGTGNAPTLVLSGTSLHITWNSAVDNVSAKDQLSYRVVQSTDATAISSVIKASSLTGTEMVLDWSKAASSADVTLATSGTTTYVAVLVRDEAGNMALYPVASTAAPSVDTVVASAVTATTLTLTWPAATDAVTSQGNLQYRVVQGSALTDVNTAAKIVAMTGAQVLKDWTSNILTLNVTGLTALTSYAFGVAVRDDAGNISVYTPVVTSTITPIGDAPTRTNKSVSNFVLYGSSLPVGHEHAAAAKIGAKMYLVGGSIGSTPDPTTIGLSTGTTTAILEATIASDGTPGAFTKSAYTLSVARKGATMLIIGKYAYVFGGYSGSGQTTDTPLTSIERATVDSSGLTSSFSVITPTLAAGRYNFVALATGGYVYVIGGGVTSATYYSNTVQRATLDTTTGEIGTFSTLTRTVVSATEADGGMVDSRETHSAVRLGNNFYIFGGADNTGQLSSIEKVVINSDGTLGHFVKQTGTLVRGRVRISVVALASKVYIFGGWNGSFLSQIESAPITDDTLGTFADVGGNTLPQPLENGTALLTDKGVFLFGGSNSGTTYSTIQYAPLVD